MNDSLRTALTLQVTLSRAYELARAGDLEAAGRMLDELGTELENSAPALDLRARVHAQRGELERADRCWAKVQQLVPADPDAAEGRRVLEQISAGRRPHRPVLHTGWLAAGGVGLVVTALVVGTAWLVPVGIGRLNDWVDDREERVTASARQARTEERRADAAEQRLAQYIEGRASAAARLDRELSAVADELELPGVRVDVRDRDIRVLFEQGVFLYETVPSERSPGLLRTLGGRLATLDVETTVVGHSIPVPGEHNSGGSELAQHRAQVAAGYLAEGGGSPLTRFSLTVADQGDGPFEDDARNRTVSLLVRPAQP